MYPAASTTPTYLAADASSAGRETSWNAWPKLFLMLAMVGVFAIVEHDPAFANTQIGALDEEDIRDDYIGQLKEGDSLRQIALIGFAAIGLATLAVTRDQLWNIRASIAVPLILLVGWTMLSVGWSEQPFVTFKRLVVLACLLIGSLGLSRYLGPKGLLWTALVTLILFVAGSLTIDVAFGGKPWQGGDYRFGGTLHPNAQANYCSLLCLAAVCCPVGFGRRWILRSLFLFGLALVVLTQSRTGLFALVIALNVVWVIRLPELLKWAGAAFLLAGFAATAMAWFSVGDAVRNQTIDTILLGRTEKASSLTGRVPLWEELLGFVGDRPVLGYGYEGFWTEDRIADIMASQKWTMQSAHNSFLDVTLELGIVGIVLAAWLLVASLLALNSAYRITKNPGFAFAMGMIAYGLANSTLESHFAKVRYSPVLALIGLMLVAFSFPIREDEHNTDEQLESAPPLPKRLAPMQEGV